MPECAIRQVNCRIWDLDLQKHNCFADQIRGDIFSLLPTMGENRKKLRTSDQVSFIYLEKSPNYGNPNKHTLKGITMLLQRITVILLVFVLALLLLGCGREQHMTPPIPEVIVMTVQP
ncbi:MAG: hypothetical protein ACP5VS_06075, partial [Desulfomonilaceae bacterium]